ncbi:serine/threonine protein kinase [Nonomuraea fuscirosea]|uniref:serine/threonine protein kinase n=1 Tax=Nonomuraea fuscirosea TaxID=1291556 RepID=UPI0033E7F0EB
MTPDDSHDQADDERVTRGTSDVAQSRSTADVSGEAPDGPAFAADQSNGLFVGPPEAPDRYELLGEGIPGGEGIIWKARYQGELTSPLPLAIKLLKRPPEARADWPSAHDQQRWRDQAVLLRHLKLDHVVRLDEVFVGAPPHPATSTTTESPTESPTESMAYLVMEWVEGPTLHASLAASPARPDTIRRRLDYVAQAGEALADLASMTRSGGNPSLHRDVKPGNCIVHAKRGLVLIDVSTLRLVDDGYDFVGWHTPAYTSPEVLAAPHLPRSVAADVYSLGALAFFCLTGQDPPVPDTPGAFARIERELEAAATAAGAGDVRRLTTHILAAMDHDASRRPSDLRSWSGDLLKAVDPAGADPAIGDAHGAPPAGRPRPPGRRRRLSVAIAAGSLAVAVGGVYLSDLLTGASGGGGQGQTPAPAAAGSTGPPPTLTTPSRTSGDAAKAGGTISSPAEGAGVKYCSYFSGTASLPPGTTLILAKQNLVNGDPNKYVELVFGYEKPSELATWRGAQYFGGENEGGVGQNYRIDLLAVDLEGARRFHDTQMSIEDVQDLVKSGSVLASVKVRRVASASVNQCPGPS